MTMLMTMKYISCPSHVPAAKRLFYVGLMSLWRCELHWYVEIG